jgi:hypothetical protein|tara:strand:+ start:796 stop:942 length:147 start_codon:yes stop_codon:yes gene_type:complete
MPNKKAKQKKQRRLALNKKWKQEGRTSNQHKKWKKKNPNTKKSIYGRR